ncbi:hypothetical protein DXG01_000629, partial [Tephrocybe rancida]
HLHAVSTAAALKALFPVVWESIEKINGNFADCYLNDPVHPFKAGILNSLEAHILQWTDPTRGGGLRLNTFAPLKETAVHVFNRVTVTNTVDDPIDYTGLIFCHSLQRCAMTGVFSILRHSHLLATDYRVSFPYTGNNNPLYLYQLQVNFPAESSITLPMTVAANISAAIDFWATEQFMAAVRTMSTMRVQDRTLTAFLQIILQHRKWHTDFSVVTNSVAFHRHQFRNNNRTRAFLSAMRTRTPPANAMAATIAALPQVHINQVLTIHILQPLWISGYVALAMTWCAIPPRIIPTMHGPGSDNRRPDSIPAQNRQYHFALFFQRGPARQRLGM